MSIRIRIAAALLAGALSVAPLAAQAQSTTIQVPAAKKWKHVGTGVIVPQALAGLPRTGITDSTAGEFDVSIQFGNPESTQLTIYLFRPALASVPVWFDRAETQILDRDIFGHAAPVSDPIAFAPPGTTTASALRRVYVPEKRTFTATGAAMVPLGEWLVAARLSSTSLDPAALDAKLLEALAALGWPAPVAGAAPDAIAAPIQPCTTPAGFSAKAKVKKPDMGAALLGALLANAADDPDIKKTPVEGPQGLCREGKPGAETATYRTLGDGKGYVIALGDAGRTISVYPEFVLDKGEPGYAVTFNDLATSYVYPSFDRLPEPGKAFEMVRKSRPISSSTRGSKALTIHTP
ncbi:hypothetical protein FHS95_003474 [Sphingomonas naasensis]|uniref:Uncharacterized protein n=1 Tax=Sphingomonas naasensis TaxID=1344951 RepID=A0A4S1WHE7_9SPHN|nr:hypothetical protein [Sphingomonas naasensis]NIJ21763.1 hypothetical protein [Sphingomonas naasensis]TGX42531.1 hypothetical protein E5A74_11900 [Sphingomonas naasensis]